MFLNGHHAMNFVDVEAQHIDFFRDWVIMMLIHFWRRLLCFANAICLFFGVHCHYSTFKTVFLEELYFHSFVTDAPAIQPYKTWPLWNVVSCGFEIGHIKVLSQTFIKLIVNLVKLTAAFINCTAAFIIGI